MMRILSLTFLVLNFISYSSSAQEYSYTHYDIGTEDGLPDVEVLQMFGDSKGRIWMAPFRKSVCYYYRDKVHNQDNDSLLKKMAELERMALQAQMNPHFIFNCLNSIQQYIFDQDIFAANKYISGFAKLIRGTLQNSTQAHIPLTDEIAYLSAYLSLEKLRFKEKMDYSIEIDPSVKEGEKDSMIPPMLIQPYVENSMRHGLRHKTDGQGHILVRFMFLEGNLAVLIEDNGVGRDKAARYKTREHIEYQSKGMSLTADRIRLINSVYGDNIRVDVTDLKNEEEQPVGTRVVIQFSKFDNGLN